MFERYDLRPYRREGDPSGERRDAQGRCGVVEQHLVRDGALVGDVEREGLAAQLDAGATFGFQFQVEGAEGYGGQLPFRDDALPLAEADRALVGRCGEHEPVGPCVLGEQPALPVVVGRQEIGRDEIDVVAKCTNLSACDSHISPAALTRAT